MVTDKQSKQNKTKQKGKTKGGLLEEQKFLSKYMSGLAPSKKDYYRRSFSESKNYDRCLISTFSQNLSLKACWLRLAGVGLTIPS